MRASGLRINQKKRKEKKTIALFNYWSSDNTRNVELVKETVLREGTFRAGFQESYKEKFWEGTYQVPSIIEGSIVELVFRYAGHTYTVQYLQVKSTRPGAYLKERYGKPVSLLSETRGEKIDLPLRYERSSLAFEIELAEIPGYIIPENTRDYYLLGDKIYSVYDLYKEVDGVNYLPKEAIPVTQDIEDFLAELGWKEHHVSFRHGEPDYITVEGKRVDFDSVGGGNYLCLQKKSTRSYANFSLWVKPGVKNSLVDESPELEQATNSLADFLKSAKKK